MMDTSGFMIKNGNTNFLNKQKDIFDLLTAVDRNAKPIVNQSQKDPFEEIDVSCSNKRKRRETKIFRGKESLFKEPQGPPPKSRRISNVPDFQKNPQRWMKYSLGDVSAEELSNESNTAVALAFLKTVQHRKAEEVKMEVEDIPGISEDSGHKFQSRIRSKKQGLVNPVLPLVDDSLYTKPIFKNSKLIMPEYVVGEKKITTKVKKEVSGKTEKEVQLTHLFQYEDE